jgi:hypothetical protein
MQLRSFSNFANIAHFMAQLVSKSLAARILGISRGTVARYCKIEPRLTQNGKVDWRALESTIPAVKMWDGRGWPLRKKRPQGRLSLRDQKQKPVFHRTMEQRLEIIAREIEAMSDQEQAQFFTLSGQVLLRKMFRQSAIDLALGSGKPNDLA